jgi:hypothetical protein
LGSTTVDAYLKHLINQEQWDTGDIRLTTASHVYGDSAKSGWVWMRDTTIGDASSNATELADDDTHSLFLWMWTRFTDANAPIYTSAGTLSTRGATAAADWSAHKSIQLCYSIGRAIGVAGTQVGLTSRTIGDHVGEETHTQSIAEMASHNHTYLHTLGGSGSNELTSGSRGEKSAVTGGAGTSAPFNVMQPTVFFNIQIKL